MRNERTRIFGEFSLEAEENESHGTAFCFLTCFAKCNKLDVFLLLYMFRFDVFLLPDVFQTSEQLCVFLWLDVFRVSQVHPTPRVSFTTVRMSGWRQ